MQREVEGGIAVGLVRTRVPEVIRRQVKSSQEGLGRGKGTSLTSSGKNDWLESFVVSDETVFDARLK